MYMFSSYASRERQQIAIVMLLGIFSGLLAGSALLKILEHKADEDAFKKESALKMVNIDAEGRVGYDRDGDLNPDYRARMKSSVTELDTTQSGEKWYSQVKTSSIERIFPKSQEVVQAFSEESQLDLLCMDEKGVVHFDRNGDGSADYYARLKQKSTLTKEDLGASKSGKDWLPLVNTNALSKWHRGL